MYTCFCVFNDNMWWLVDTFENKFLCVCVNPCSSCQCWCVWFSHPFRYLCVWVSGICMCMYVYNGLPDVRSWGTRQSIRAQYINKYCMHVCICICMHMYMHACIHTYTYIQIHATCAGNIVFDNILITNSEESAREFAKKTWAVRHKVTLCLWYVPVCLSGLPLSLIHIHVCLSELHATSRRQYTNYCILYIHTYIYIHLRAFGFCFSSQLP